MEWCIRVVGVHQQIDVGNDQSGSPRLLGGI
jgi:hypothetical protein